MFSVRSRKFEISERRLCPVDKYYKLCAARVGGNEPLAGGIIFYVVEKTIKGVFFKMRKPIVLAPAIVLAAFSLAGFIIGCDISTLGSGFLEAKPAEASAGFRAEQLSTSKIRSGETITMPSQSYIGHWYTDNDRLDDLTIHEINSTIKFELAIFRTLLTNGIAKIENDKIVFNTDANFSGTMQFNENSILITVDESDFEYITAGTKWNFTVRE